MEDFIHDTITIESASPTTSTFGGQPKPQWALVITAPIISGYPFNSSIPRDWVNQPEPGDSHHVAFKRGKLKQGKESVAPEDLKIYNWWWNITAWHPRDCDEVGCDNGTPGTIVLPMQKAEQAPQQAPKQVPQQVPQKSPTLAQVKHNEEWHKDRRTALMYSVECAKIMVSEDTEIGELTYVELEKIRNTFFKWLRAEETTEEEGQDND